MNSELKIIIMAARVRALLVCLICLFIVSMLFSEAEAGRKHSKKSSSKRKADPLPFNQQETVIGYDPLRIGNRIPCNGKNGDNCRIGNQANPYQRPCSKDNGCDREPSDNPLENSQV